MATYPNTPDERAERLKLIRLARIVERIAKRVNTSRGYRMAAKLYDRAEGCAGLSICNDVLRARVERYSAMARSAV